MSFAPKERTHTTTKGTVLPLVVLKGKDYLEVKYRLVWFREEHPTYGIETEAVALSQSAATFRATIKDQNGRTLAMAHKSEDKAGFHDFMEKAETGAIGRALALIGYGTQFCSDELDEGERIVDAPADPRSAIGRRPPALAPDHPAEGDGIPGFGDGVYRLDFGKWRMRSLDELYNDPKIGPQGIASYIDWLEADAQKKNQPVGLGAARFIEEATRYLGAIERRGA